MTIKYSRQWGNSGAWREITLPPGTTETHSHLLDRDGRAPTPYIDFFYLVGNKQQLPVPNTRKYRRMAFFRVIDGGYGPAPRPARPKPYRFVLSPDGRTLSLRAMP
jgi:hypothetical protein